MFEHIDISHLGFPFYSHPIRTSPGKHLQIFEFSLQPFLASKALPDFMVPPTRPKVFDFWSFSTWAEIWRNAQWTDYNPLILCSFAGALQRQEYQVTVKIIKKKPELLLQMLLLLLFEPHEFSLRDDIIVDIGMSVERCSSSTCRNITWCPFFVGFVFIFTRRKSFL